MVVFNRATVLFILGGSLLTACVTTPSGTATNGQSDDDDSYSSDVCNGTVHKCRAKLKHVSTRARSDAQPTGLAPADLASAYGFNPSANPGATIAVIDAYGYTDLESDLASYRSMFSLPPCTSASGCLKIIGQTGGAPPTEQPPSGDDWTVETALDVDMASAACPQCKIVVVEANDDTSDGLDIANDAAATAGASVISNSWGGAYTSSDSSENAHFDHAGVAIFVATGDNGESTADFPSTSEYVIGVGGTNLQKASNTRGWTETAWTDGGSSCNTKLYTTQPTWQTGVVPTTACKGRAASDTAAVADADNSPLIIFNAGQEQLVGGTSAASPLVAGIFAVTGNAKQTNTFIYANTTAFNDVTSGTNGSCGTALCTAGTGWDGPTGIGTPIATAMAALSGEGSGSGSGTGSGSGEGSGSGNQGSGSNEGSGGDQGSGSDGDGDGSNGDNNGGNGSSGGGGCSTTGGSSAFAILFGIGLAFTRRRRAA
jgi:MYXO-CTERM domain-containing protein